MSESTYRCAVCLDHGFTSREVMVRGDRCSMASFCEGTPAAPCAIGMASETGYWAEKLKPFGTKRVSDSVKAKLLERTRIHQHGFELQSRVMRLLETKTKESLEATDGH